jgi:hypothetical protein
MQTYSTAFARELAKLLHAEIERLAENLTLGMSITDYAEYKKAVGEIQGLKKAIGYFEEADKNVDNR